MRAYILKFKKKDLEILVASLEAAGIFDGIFFNGFMPSS
jgi:uncharacterized membrane protein